MNPLSLSSALLVEVSRTLTARIEAGLRSDGREIKALPSHLGPPDPGTRGAVLAFDTGGTNMRAALIEVDEQGARVSKGPVERRVPDGRDGAAVRAEEFFGAHADLAEELGARDLPVGYCFSYPSQSLPDRDAILLSWTKGLRVEGVEGQRVGRALRQALEARALRPGPVTVLNDTVAALLALGPSPRGIGLIVGTGHNVASYYPLARIPKLGRTNEAGRMAVNLECGNFHPPHLSALDDELDRRLGDQPGTQRLEKAVSGFYLPKLFNLIDPEHPVEDGKALVERAQKDGPGGVTARALIERSADLVAAVVAGVIRSARDDEGPMVEIQAEGGLFASPGYEARFKSTLAMLSDEPFQIRRAPEANLRGSARAALSKP